MVTTTRRKNLSKETTDLINASISILSKAYYRDLSVVNNEKYTRIIRKTIVGLRRHGYTGLADKLWDLWGRLHDFYNIYVKQTANKLLSTGLVSKAYDELPRDVEYIMSRREKLWRKTIDLINDLEKLARQHR